MLFQRIQVALDERVVVFRSGLPVRELGPGRAFAWGWQISLRWFDVDELVFDAPPEVRAVLDPSSFTEVTLDREERGVLYRDGRPVRFLAPGTVRYWTLDPSVQLRVYSTREPMPELTESLLAILPASAFTRVTVQPSERGLEIVSGELRRVLGPGRYAFWVDPDAVRTIVPVDMRRQQLQITGQELMTRDKVTLRLNLIVEFQLIDPVKAFLEVGDVRDAIYAAAQLAVREYVAGVTLDELLESREAMSEVLEGAVVPRISALGARVDRVGLKDIILPGDMKTLLNRVIEAEKSAAANVILRREEAAATRSLANTAKIMADNPVLLRLRELDALKEIAAEISDVRVVVGADGLKKLIPGMLGDRSSSG